MGEDPVDRQQHKVRETDIMDKNNYAEDQELIEHFSESFCSINLHTVQNNHKVWGFFLFTGTLIIPINGFFKAKGTGVIFK